jgi:hypothetical protein
MKCAVESGSGGMKNLQSFMKIGIGVQGMLRFGRSSSTDGRSVSEWTRHSIGLTIY